MFVLPNNKKERYDALKKCTCVDYAGKYLYLWYFNKVKVTQFDDIYIFVCVFTDNFLIDKVIFLAYFFCLKIFVCFSGVLWKIWFGDFSMY